MRQLQITWPFKLIKKKKKALVFFNVNINTTVNMLSFLKTAHILKEPAISKRKTALINVIERPWK